MGGVQVAVGAGAASSAAPALDDLHGQPPAAAQATRTVGRTRPVKTLRQPTHGFAKLLSIFRRAGVKDLNQFL
jgi:hypothetical protein